MQSIRLERGEWQFDEKSPLGPAGGFGEVFLGNGNGQDVAVKRLKISAGAASHREMSIGAALADREHEHVVPVLDFGQDADSDRYYLVMPVCEKSLQDAVNDAGVLGWDDAKRAILGIIQGLLEVGDIVHRDLKPGNVLWHEGRWKIADFGIAKFVEDSTSLETLRSSLTPAYAAPEQWRGERPTKATDIYALGCIIHALIMGRPPFVGNADDIRQAHLHTPPPTLSDVDARFAGLVNTMLRKSQSSRPTLARCEMVISSLANAPVSSARAALAAAGRAVSEEEAAAEAARTAQEAADRERQALETDGLAELSTIIQRLFDEIEQSSESVRREKRSIRLGAAHLTWDEGSRTTLGRLRPTQGTRNPYNHGWDVAANAYLNLRCSIDRVSLNQPSDYVFATTLAFASIPGDETFRWREISFMEVFSQKPMAEQPIALNPLGEDFAVALSNVMGRHQVACGPWNIDGEDEGAFQERWLKLFAKAASRQLYPPHQLPLPDSFFA